MKHYRFLPTMTAAALAVALVTPSLAHAEPADRDTAPPETESQVTPAQAEKEAAMLVTKARHTLETFDAAGQAAAFEAALRDGHAVIIVPEYVRAGFLLGGEGGNAVLLTKDATDGSWSAPAFYEVKGGSVGLQIGFEKAQVAMVVKDAAMLDALLAGKVTFGADASVVAGDQGARADALLTGAEKPRVQVFVLRDGAFAGATVKGGNIEPKAMWNQAFYGTTDISPRTIAQNPMVQHDKETEPLRKALHAMSSRDTAQVPR